MGTWAKTKTDRYLQAALELNNRAHETKTQPTATEYKQIIPVLLQAIVEQVMVFGRLRLELQAKTLPWNRPGFVDNPEKLLVLAEQAQVQAMTWSGEGRPEDRAIAVFQPLSASFINLVECCAIIRKDLGWMPPHREEPPSDGGPDHGGPGSRDPKIPVYPAG